MTNARRFRARCRRAHHVVAARAAVTRRPDAEETPAVLVTLVWDQQAVVSGLPGWLAHSVEPAADALVRLARFTLEDLRQGLRMYVEPRPSRSESTAGVQVFCPRGRARLGHELDGPSPLGWAQFMERRR